MFNYQVVLFKNKVAKKILKEFVTLKKAKEFYNKQLKVSGEVIYDVNYENGKPSKFELAIIENSSIQLVPVYLTDEIGRNVKVKLDSSGMTLMEITNFKKEEKIYDLSLKKKITVKEMIHRYLRGEGLKMVSGLNNKVIIQNDEKCNLFSLKNLNEVSRFLEILTSYFLQMNKKDCLVVKDISSAQKKYLLKILSELGYDKSMLYRKTTTHPRSLPKPQV